MSAGNALVLLPGLDGTGLLFKPLVEALPPSVNPIVVAYPPDAELGYDSLLPRVLQALPSDSHFVLLAESFSGPLALRVGAIAPSGLRGVVLCASFITNPLPYFPSWGAVLLHPLLFRLFPPASHAKALLGRRVNSDLRVLSRSALSQVHPRALAARARSALRVNVSPELSQCPVPILYLRGTRDWVVPRRNIAAILRVNPRVSVVHIQAPHMVLQTRPSEAAREIAAFVGSVAAG